MSENLIYTEEEIARQRISDREERDAAWQKIRDDIAAKVGGELADETVAAFREHFSLFGDGAVEWFANLYDPVIGGYYYSNSGKETPLFRPDIESTYQALNFMSGSGMTAKADSVVPAWCSESIVRFTKGLQDPNGYFYHPQWGKRVTDLRHHSRRGRDLTNASRVLARFGASPTYDTPLGTKGDGLLADGTPTPCCEIREKCEVNTQKSSTYAEHLASAEGFRKYLEGLELSTNSYYIGNLFESQSDQIAARDKQLAEEGADYRLTDILVDWLTEKQNPKTGVWTPDERITYDSINGLLKIISTFHRLGRPFPRIVEAFRSAMKVIAEDIDPLTVCFVLNPWYAMVTMIDNVDKFYSPNDGNLTAEAIDSLRREMLMNAPTLIRATTAKMRKFLKADGSFSYMQAHSGPNSQGLPVAIAWTNEGDVNASYICIVATTSHIFSVFGYRMPHIYGEADRMRYMNILERNRRDPEYWEMRVNQLK